MAEPHVHHFAGGWAAAGDGFATFAKTREEAIRQYEAYEAQRCHSAGCDARATRNLSGVPLCDEHYQNVVSRSGAGEGMTRSEDVRHSNCEPRKPR
jgi:hypothetical protein